MKACFAFTIAINISSGLNQTLGTLLSAQKTARNG